MKHSNKKVGNILTILYLIVLPLFLFLFKFGTVMSGSMLPTIQINEAIVYMPIIKIDSVKEGDIVIYKSSNNSYIIHRVKNIELTYNDNNKIERILTMKGDNNYTEDFEKVTSANYVGKVVKIIHNTFLCNVIRITADTHSKLRLLLILFIPISYFLLLGITYKKEEQINSINTLIENESTSMEEKKDDN